jgi:hypothetical protein
MPAASPGYVAQYFSYNGNTFDSHDSNERQAPNESETQAPDDSETHVPDDFETQAPEVLHGAQAEEPASQALRASDVLWTRFNALHWRFIRASKGEAMNFSVGGPNLYLYIYSPSLCAHL